VTLPPFQLHRPRSVEEATQLLEQHGDDAALYCGGTELLLLLKLGFASFGQLVDLKGIEELRGVRADDGALVIGAAVTHRSVERDPLVLERLPVLAAMERGVANIRVRNVGTLGGNLCFSDPHSDPATFLLALDAEVECRRGGDPARRVALADFTVGPYQTALRPGELLTAVRIPLPPSGTRIVHRKLRFHERPAVTVTCAVRADGGSVAEARIAVGSVGVVPVRAVEAERLLTDGQPLAAASASAAAVSGAVEDANGSVEYKENLVRVLVERALQEVIE
jgi:aerobic carbon-monoxide dehydrogenase medium subunit